MKKQRILNLIKYYSEKNDAAFISEAIEIAKEFDRMGDTVIAEYLMELISSPDRYASNSNYDTLHFLQKAEYSAEPLLLPDIIGEDIKGLIRAINNESGLSKFLLYGTPGSGKTKSAYQIARLLKRDILTVPFEQLIDSRLGESAKNVSLLFEEINHLPYSKILVLLDEIDSLVLNRMSRNDLREMGRVTSIFLKGMDSLNENIIFIATTNMFGYLDKALIRRFDAAISFDRYSKNDLIEIADSMLTAIIKKSPGLKLDIRFFNKILKNLSEVPFPGDLKQIIKTSVAFSDHSLEYDYLRKLYLALNNNPLVIDAHSLNDDGYTAREIKILTRYMIISK